jgi:hypothetical protein
LANNIQLLDEAEQNIVIYQSRADQLFADAEGRGIIAPNNVNAHETSALKCTPI